MPDHEGRTTVEKLETIRGLFDELEGVRRERDEKMRMLLKEVLALLEPKKEPSS